MTISVDRLLEIFDAALSADYPRLRKCGNAVARSLADDGDAEGAAAIRSVLRKKGVPLQTSGYMEQLPVDLKSRLPLVEEQDWPSIPIFLDASSNAVLTDFVEDVANSDVLAKKGLSSKLALMLSGEPGTGKSLLAGHIAAQLGRPLYVVRLDSVISSLLGDTAKNIRSIFDFIPTRGAVLFLDEIDAVAKLRDDRQELGELKRVVNTVIQGLDSLDDDAIVIAATNHPQLLDPAIWRRFPYRIDIGHPDFDVRQSMWKHFLFADEENDVATLLAQLSEGRTGSEIEAISLAARRRALLSNNGELDILSVVVATLDAENSKSLGSVRRPDDDFDKRQIALKLKSLDMTPPQIAKLLGVSRQWALKLLSEQ